MVSEYFGGGGDSGFTSTPDGAEATLSVNMPDDAARNLWDVQAAIQQIATDFQTAVRAAADFNTYLISIRETSQTVKMPSLGMEGGEGTGGTLPYAGGRVDASSAAISSGEAGQVARIGEMLGNQSGDGGGAMASRGIAPTGDAGNLINQISNAGWMIDMTGRGHHGMGSVGGMGQPGLPPSEAENEMRLLRGGGPLSLNLLAAASRAQATTNYGLVGANAIQQGLGPTRQFLGMGGIGGFAAMAGRLGTVGAVGYAAYQLGDTGLQTYGQGRTMAISANNTAGGMDTQWGIQQRVGEAMMAMSPYVTSDEAAQIYNTAIDQGWASKNLPQGTFGQATNFMYTAARDYNMNPTASAQLLDASSLKAGQSVQALSEQLLTLQKTLDGTGVSMSVATTGYTNLYSQLISMGTAPGTASNIAGGVVSAFSKNSALGNTGLGAQIISQTLASQQTQNLLSGITGAYPGTAFIGDNAGRSMQELDQLNYQMAREALNAAGGNMTTAAGVFMQMYSATHQVPIDANEALNLVKGYSSDPNFFAHGGQAMNAHSTMGKQQSRSLWEQQYNRWMDLSHGSTMDKILAETPIGLGIAAWGSGTTHSAANYSPEVQRVLDNVKDPSKVSIQDDQGNVVASGADAVAQWFSSSDNYNKFTASGSKYKIHDDSSNNDWNNTNIGSGGSNPMAGQGGSNDSNTVYIQLSSAAQQWFDTNVSSLNLTKGSNVNNGG